MKKTLQYSFLTAFLLLSTVISLNAQPHAGEQSGSGTIDGGRIGAGAPVGNGTFILLTLSVAYVARKIYGIRETAETE